MTNYGIWSQVGTQLVVFVGLTVLLCIQLKITPTCFGNGYPVNMFTHCTFLYYVVGKLLICLQFSP